VSDQDLSNCLINNEIELLALKLAFGLSCETLPLMRNTPFSNKTVPFHKGVELRENFSSDQCKMKTVDCRLQTF